jgi:hypothetical protein
MIDDYFLLRYILCFVDLVECHLNAFRFIRNQTKIFVLHLV